MKTQVLALALIFGTLFVACAQTKKTTAANTQTTSASSKTSNLRGITDVMMRRGACFGRCPEYTITIHSNGLAEYNGIRNTTPLGTYQKNIGEDKARVLLQAFANNRADTCRAFYEARIADAPTLSFKLTKNGQEQTIGNASFGPRFLVDLAEDMDALGKVDEHWKKINEGPQPD
jgi:hypothetical protein